MIGGDVIEAIRAKYEAIRPELDERSRRLWAAAEATALGHGGVAAVSKATGIAESTIRIGRREMNSRPVGQKAEPTRRIRKPGGGRKPLIESDKELLGKLDALVEPASRGDPMSPLRWTCKSTRRLARELTAQGNPVSHAKVGQLLEKMGYSLQSNRKRMEGKSHPDRNAQFEFIYEKVKEFQSRRQPVISVDAKKKELIGRFRNGGREFQPKGKPEEVETVEANGRTGVSVGQRPSNHGRWWRKQRFPESLVEVRTPTFCG